MTDQIELQLDTLHEDLALLYRAGGHQKALINEYWSRIERLEVGRVRGLTYTSKGDAR